VTSPVAPQTWSLLADAVVGLHAAWLLFLIFGALLGRRVRWVRRLHVAGLALALVLTAAGWLCPLTHLEVWLRGRGGSGAYSETFVGHYAERLVYAPVPRPVVLAGALAVTIFSLLAYRHPRRRGR